MKNLILIFVIATAMFSCNTTSKTTSSSSEMNSVDQDTVRIANEESNYEIIIIEPGFNSWLQGRAKPEGYYTQQYLETRNLLYVTAWNNRVLNPSQYDPNLYEIQIDYNSAMDYGYEVNYKLYYYFIYFQMQYKQQLTNFKPRI